MRGRTSAEAVSNYRQDVQVSVSCVTNSVVDVAGGYHPRCSSKTVIQSDSVEHRGSGSGCSRVI